MFLFVTFIFPFVLVFEIWKRIFGILASFLSIPQPYDSFFWLQYTTTKFLHILQFHYLSYKLKTISTSFGVEDDIIDLNFKKEKSKTNVKELILQTVVFFQSRLLYAMPIVSL